MIPNLLLDSFDAVDIKMQKSAQTFKENWLEERQKTLELMRKAFEDNTISLNEIKYTQYVADVYEKFWYILIDYQTPPEVKTYLGQPENVFIYKRENFIFSRSREWGCLQLRSLHNFKTIVKNNDIVFHGMDENGFFVDIHDKSGLHQAFNSNLFLQNNQVLDYPRDLYWYGEKE